MSLMSRKLEVNHVVEGEQTLKIIFVVDGIWS